MRVFYSPKWAVLPLAISLTGCSFLGGATVKGTPSTLLAYISMQSMDKVAVVGLIQRTPEGDPIEAGATPANMALNPRSDREYLYVANHSGNSVSFLNVRTREREVSVPSGDRPWDVAITPKGDFLYVTNTGDKTVSLIDVENRARVKVFTFEASAYPNFSPRGIVTHGPTTDANDPRRGEGYAISEGNAGTAGAPAGEVVVLKGETTGTKYVVNGASKLWKGAVSPDGKRLLVTDRGRSTLWSIDLSSGAAKAIPVSGTPWDVVVNSSIEKPVAFVSMPEAGLVSSVDLTTETEIKAIPATPAGTNNRNRQPQALALNSQGTELWAALAGTNEVVYFPFIEGANFSDVTGARLVTYSYTPGQTGAPEDIVLGRGVR